jgi:hypothetical protein
MTISPSGIADERETHPPRAVRFLFFGFVFFSFLSRYTLRIGPALIPKFKGQVAGLAPLLKSARGLSRENVALKSLGQSSQTCWEDATLPHSSCARRAVVRQRIL